MSIGRTSKKSRQREQLILAMLQQPTIEKAAECAGISPTTAWRITKTPEFQEELRIARRESFSHSIARFQQAAPAAISILLKLMLDPNTPAASRERAAYHVLVQAAKPLKLRISKHVFPNWRRPRSNKVSTERVTLSEAEYVEIPPAEISAGHQLKTDHRTVF